MELSIGKILILIFIVSGIESEDLSLGSRCQINKSTEGSCVDIDSCSIIRDKLRHGTIRMNQVAVCNNLMRYVCCPVETSFLSSRLNLDRCKDIFLDISLILMNLTIFLVSSWNLIEVN
jgi:hypothetical protein